MRYLSRFIRVLDIPLINCEVSTKNYIAADAANNLPEVPAINNPSNSEFSITDCKLYVPVVNLSTEFENKLYQQLKEGFTVNVYCDKFRCQVTNQRAGNINYLIDPTFDNVSKLYVLAYENEEDRSSFSKYYTPTVKVTDYNVLIDQQPFFELAVKNSNDYKTGSLLNYDYFLNHYKLVAIDLSKQDIDLTRQQINFVGKLNQNATIFFIIEKSEKTTLKFSQNCATIV